MYIRQFCLIKLDEDIKHKKKRERTLTFMGVKWTLMDNLSLRNERLSQILIELVLTRPQKES